jgi:hypothetical protein
MSLSCNVLGLVKKLGAAKYFGIVAIVVGLSVDC